MFRIVKIPRTRDSFIFALTGAAALVFSAPAVADADTVDFNIFKDTKCSATQIYHAMEKVAPAEMAKIKSGPVGSRRQKWLLNWLIHSRESVDIDSPTSKSGGRSDPDWGTYFAPYARQIAEDCPNE
ncbi:MAG: tat pathway signal sequence [Segniliparus sp.]|uniref:tat pathway signal sequence n=1 Tax=Segniliparus sp. TaxID=2804064 RepID=UPI003F3D215A